jgi:hypothetical protein
MRDIVGQVRARPRVEERTFDVLDTTKEAFRGPDGRVFTVVERHLSVADVAGLAARGAWVAWDACGCHGYCDLDWFEPPTVAAVETRPTLGRLADLSEWLCEDDGSSLILATGEVRWRGLFP